MYKYSAFTLGRLRAASSLKGTPHLKGVGLSIASGGIERGKHTPFAFPKLNLDAVTEELGRNYPIGSNEYSRALNQAKYFSGRSLLGHGMTNAIKDIPNFSKSVQKWSPEQREAFDRFGILHEKIEQKVKPTPVPWNTHRSWEAIVRESRFLAKMPEHLRDEIIKFYRPIREAEGSVAAIQKAIPSFEYGKTFIRRNQFPRFEQALSGAQSSGIDLAMRRKALTGAAHGMLNHTSPSIQARGRELLEALKTDEGLKKLVQEGQRFVA